MVDTDKLLKVLKVALDHGSANLLTVAVEDFTGPQTEVTLRFKVETKYLEIHWLSATSDEA